MFTNASSIKIKVLPSIETNGDPITSYSVYIDGGSLSTSFTKNTRYNGTAEEFTISVSDDALVLGKTYRIVTTSTNDIGESSYSQEVRASVSDLPSKPAQVWRSVTASTRTQLVIEWAIEPD
jgi:hypothetical protein